ncbi:hypothetical protein ABZX77_30440 [Streptomyces sp. NPDC004237]|uniref:hypothetical protein n=1 Tax=Streptomyces sp. NPDC004237 TaxID=3154455 RepID=UPI0033B5BD00
MSRTYPTDPWCTDKAVWHVAWVLAPRGHFSLLCETHMAATAERYDYVDRHPVEIACNMPSFAWALRSGRPSSCVTVASDQVHQERPQ